jgi:hypothetical protein
MTTSADAGQSSRLVAGSGIGWALDAMDVGLISFVMTALAVQWALDDTTLMLGELAQATAPAEGALASRWELC